jgi:hypothetical protein
MTRLLLVMLFTGPTKVILPGLKATFGVGVTSVVVAVVPVVDCPDVLPAFVHAVMNCITRIIMPTSRP